jgi:hypothetical protein
MVVVIMGIFRLLVVSNPPEADYNRNVQSTDVLLSFPAEKGGNSRPPALRVIVDSDAGF